MALTRVVIIGKDAMTAVISWQLRSNLSNILTACGRIRVEYAEMWHTLRQFDSVINNETLHRPDTRLRRLKSLRFPVPGV